MRIWLAALFLCVLGSCRPKDSVDIYGFLSKYRVSHYLSLAGEMQKLNPDRRAAALRELARHPLRGSEIFPLCRMLFEANKGGEFRRPLIGAPYFVGETEMATKEADCAKWPLEPITIYKGMPILIATGYVLGGVPEPPSGYVEYCLASCRWSETRFTSRPRTTQLKIVTEFCESNPKWAGEADWFRAQAE